MPIPSAGAVHSGLEADFIGRGGAGRGSTYEVLSVPTRYHHKRPDATHNTEGMCTTHVWCHTLWWGMAVVSAPAPTVCWWGVGPRTTRSRKVLS